jgi:AcrR family transcriptional regulator
MSSPRRQPVQQRSRDRVDAILRAASTLIAEDGSSDNLSVSAVAQRSGVPVGTLYQYFANSDDIVKALLDHEMAAMDAAVAEAVGALDRVSLRGLCEAAIRAHFRYHRSHPTSATLWFSGRQSEAVREHIRRQDARVANWLYTANMAAGFLRADTPSYGVELIARITDRMFEFTFVPTRPEAEQDDIVTRFVDMVAAAIEQYATPAGLNGVASGEFIAALTASSLAASDGS